MLWLMSSGCKFLAWISIGFYFGYILDVGLLSQPVILVRVFYSELVSYVIWPGIMSDKEEDVYFKFDEQLV